MKILSIDGGGIRGVYSISFLNQLEKKYCYPKNKLLHNYFDIITGTSTGSIIGCGLACKYPMNYILDIYVNNSNKMFYDYDTWSHNIAAKSVHHIFGYKYNNEILIEMCDKHFGNKTLDDIENDIYIPSYNITESKCVIFQKGKNIKIKDAILSSTSAPTYFRSYKIDDKIYMDGGIYKNNPSIIGILEAFRKYKASKCKVLSVGNIIQNICTESTRWNFYQMEELYDIITTAKQQSDDYIIKNLSGILDIEYHRIAHINRQLNSTYYKMDNSSQKYIDYLIQNGIYDFDKFDKEYNLENYFIE
jgi:patatin-like phospholipase/acyl hydrolase